MHKIPVLTVFLAASMFAGCGRWNVERHDAEAAEHFDARLSSDATRENFLAMFPNAVLLDEQSGTARYLVYEESTCFWCYSSAGFVRSSDVFARVVIFDGDRLSAIEPAREATK